MATSTLNNGRSAEAWGAVRRGFAVWLADGRRGSVVDIRFTGGGGIELLVTTGLFFPTLVTVRPDEIEVILPRERRIIVGEAEGDDHETRADGDGEAHRTTVSQLPVKHSSPSDWPLDAA